MKEKKFLLLYGLIGGIVTIIGFFLWHLLSGGDIMENMYVGQLIGYSFMLLALSTVFFGLRTLREKNGGSMSFKEGFLNGMIVVLVASVIYVVGWMVYYPNFMPDFAQQYTENQIESLKTQHLSPEELQRQIDELIAFQEMYEQPAVMAGFTFMEIFPVGLFIALVSALILRRKPD